MEERVHALGLCVDSLCGTELLKSFGNDFNQRILLQKSTYLLQCWGIDLGYRYNWYIRGPYSPDLTAHAFCIAENYSQYVQECKDIQLTDEVKNIIVKCVEWIKETRPANLGEIDWQELLASVHYIQHNVYISGKGKDKVIDFVLNKKAWFTKEQASAAYTALDRVGLISNTNIEYQNSPGAAEIGDSIRK